MPKLTRQHSGRFVLREDIHLLERNPAGYRHRWQEAVDEALKAGFRYDTRAKVKTWFTHDVFNASMLDHYADDELRQWFAGMRNRYEGLLQLSRATDSALYIPVPPGEKLYPFQRAAVEYAMTCGNALIGDEMGLGKTIVAASVINLAKPDTVLVICPASLKYNWRDELSHWLVERYSIRVSDSKRIPTALEMAFGGTVVILNYDVLFKHVKLLSSIPWDMVICDEAHRLKNPSARWTQAALASMNKAERKLMLTGTPIPNGRPAEAWNLIHELQPQLWSVKTAFIEEYCQNDPQRAATPQVLNKLQERLRGTVMIRRLYDEVQLELPPMTERIILLEPPTGVIEKEQQELAKHRQLVEAMKRELANLDTATDKKAVARASFRLKAISGFAGPIETIRKETAIAKLPQTIDHLKLALEAGDGKIIFFAHNREILERVHEAFGKQSVLLYGGMSGNQKHEAVKAFQTDPKIRLFCGSITAAGLGYTLNEAHLMVFAQLPWTPGELSQAKKRFHRIGQDKPVLVQHLIFDGSLDAYMAQSIVVKQGVIDLSLDESMEQYFEALGADDPDKAIRSLEAQGEDVSDFALTVEETSELGLHLITPEGFAT